MGVAGADKGRDGSRCGPRWRFRGRSHDRGFETENPYVSGCLHSWPYPYPLPKIWYLRLHDVLSPSARTSPSLPPPRTARVSTLVSVHGTEGRIARVGTWRLEAGDSGGRTGEGEPPSTIPSLPTTGRHPLLSPVVTNPDPRPRIPTTRVHPGRPVPVSRVGPRRARRRRGQRCSRRRSGRGLFCPSRVSGVLRTHAAEGWGPGNVLRLSGNGVRGVSPGLFARPVVRTAPRPVSEAGSGRTRSGVPLQVGAGPPRVSGGPESGVGRRPESRVRGPVGPGPDETGGNLVLHPSPQCLFGKETGSQTAGP